MTSVLSKRAGEKLIYRFTYTDRDPTIVVASAAPITQTSMGLVSGSGALTLAGQVADSGGVSVTISGGAEGEDYLLLCAATDGEGEIHHASALLRISATAYSPLIVEDGTGLADAESYASVAEADSYLRDRGVADTWDTYTADRKAGLLRQATAMIDAQARFDGSIVTASQALSWPRSGCVDNEGRTLANNVIPARIKHAVIEIARLGDLQTAPNRVIKSRTVGPITEEYDSERDATQGASKYSLAWALLRPLMTVSSSSSIPMVRA